MQRRMAYRLPEKKYNKLVEKLEKEGLSFEDFIDQTIDLYLEDQLNPKEETDGWGKWMDE